MVSFEVELDLISKRLDKLVDCSDIHSSEFKAQLSVLKEELIHLQLQYIL